jgi:ABC-2 type transport system permease protein
MLVGFVAGSFFPLDLLPKPIYQMLLFSPFPYLFYLPAKIFLGVSGKQLIPYYFISLSWVLIFWRLTSLMWAKGNKSFSFWGR